MYIDCVENNFVFKNIYQARFFLHYWSAFLDRVPSKVLWIVQIYTNWLKYSNLIKVNQTCILLSEKSCYHYFSFLVIDDLFPTGQQKMKKRGLWLGLGVPFRELTRHQRCHQSDVIPSIMQNKNPCRNLLPNVCYDNACQSSLVSFPNVPLIIIYYIC